MIDGHTICMVSDDNNDYLLDNGIEKFSGEKCGEFTLSPLTHENAVILRELFDFTCPKPVLRENCSFGVGDRLGLATDGHISVFENYNAYPVLVQQSIRELNLTGRTYENVLDCASFSVFKNGFKKPFGADGDHLKTPEDIEYALGLGFTMITLDCSEHISNSAAKLSKDELDKTEIPAEIAQLYLEKNFDVGEGLVLTFDKTTLAQTYLIYHKAIDFACDMFNKYITDKVDFEVSIDETETPTTPLQHFYAANELIRRGVKVTTVAPRFCGEFQKGIDYIGNIGQFEEEMKLHCTIARHFGYKISVHSGSDKFSVFPIIGKYTNGNFHVKTAGTNWLEAMKVIAQTEPALYREIHAFALANFSEATKYYHVTTDINKIPALDTLTDAELPSLFTMNDARQLIHITYGLILSEKNSDGSFKFRDLLYKAWRVHAAEYKEALYNHISRHLDLLGTAKA
ncbi:MAG: hypothetical protein E7588_02045 [Ruminococcaceae bacterium]|nr:hypothetical protein [Oscillospiraceae bacterium]